jgi:hypothetical protein
MLALASIGKLKMVKDFPLPVDGIQAWNCGRNLCDAHVPRSTARYLVAVALPREPPPWAHKFQINSAG